MPKSILRPSPIASQNIRHPSSSNGSRKNTRTSSTPRMPPTQSETLGGIVATEESGGAATAAPHFVQKDALSATRGVPQVMQKRGMSVFLYRAVFPWVLAVPPPQPANSNTI